MSLSYKKPTHWFAGQKYAHIFTNAFYDKPNRTINTMELITRSLELWSSVMGCALYNVGKLPRIRINEKQEIENRILFI